MARILLRVLLAFAFFEAIHSGTVNKEMEKEFQDLLKNADDGASAEEMAGLFEGDIEMDDNMKQALIGGKISSRDAILSPIYHWPNGILYYKIHSSISHYAKCQIRRAMEHLEKYTCVIFKECCGPFFKKGCVVFFKGRGCYSRIGRRPNKRSQRISIGRGCTRLGTIVHEIMHALGFFHEQSRQDRDKFVKIIWKNIIKKHVRNFRKYPRNIGTTLGKPYDYLSVMHYSKYAFSKQRRRLPTIVPLKKHALIGQRFGLSYYDAYQINKLYKCHPRCRDIHHPFVCEYFKAKGFCYSYRHSSYMKAVCKRTCTNCGRYRRKEKNCGDIQKLFSYFFLSKSQR